MRYEKHIMDKIKRKNFFERLYNFGFDFIKNLWYNYYRK